MIKNRFEKAYDALVKAYFEGTLKKGECGACAVGNICLSAGMEKTRRPEGDRISTDRIFNNSWALLFATYQDGEQVFKDTFRFNPPKYSEEELKITLLDKTGYSWEELAKIEYAFEVNTKIFWDEYSDDIESEILTDQYNGLVAVLKVMEELDGIEHSDTNRFMEHPKLVLA